MNAPQLFSFERALRITAPEDPRVNRQGLAFRPGQVLRLEPTAGDPAGDASRSVRLDPPLPTLRRLSALDTLSLRRPSYSVLDGRTGLLLTYVLRHSPTGLRWRDSQGECVRLAPGGMFVSQARHDTLVELSPAVFDEPCECVRLLLQTDSPLELAVRVAGEDLPFCNSAQACVRVMLGRYRDHATRMAPGLNLNVLDLDLAPFSELELPVAPERWALALLTSGTLQLQGAVMEAHTAIAFFGVAPLARLASQTGASLLWLDLPYVKPFKPAH